MWADEEQLQGQVAIMKVIGWDGMGWNGMLCYVMLYNMMRKERQERNPQSGLYLNLILASNLCMHLIGLFDVSPRFYYLTSNVMFTIIIIGSS